MIDFIFKTEAQTLADGSSWWLSVNCIDTNFPIDSTIEKWIILEQYFYSSKNLNPERFVPNNIARQVILFYGKKKIEKRETIAIVGIYYLNQVNFDRELISETDIL